MNRKEFIFNCTAACLGTAVFATFLESCKPSAVIAGTVEGSKLKIKKMDMGQLASMVVRNDKLQGPVYLSRISDTEYSAVLMICTHKGCELKTGGTKLICPCHGAEFSGAGKVLSPPANEDLKKYSTSTDNEYVYIEL